ncbi:hypothetical protein GDO86_000570 [Hymenochirus boettgeri]|uniref:Cadherin domain-containing protein n=1 Tax=Hymenochirus boettgeri TaxID=247094 RepID=A0A8T2K926_9PIPI|nr:hypothetical protein GDO86_000570 [Hymenochirus boettgeri]
MEPVSYKLISGDSYQWFTIESQSGIIRTQKELDYESQALVVLTIQSQLGRSSVFSSTHVNITITDVNDNPPVFPQENDRISIHQNATPGTVLYIAQATDIDSGYNGQISYSIVSENKDMYIIDPTLGVLYLNAYLSMKCDDILQIMAEDNGHPVQSSLLTLIINVEQKEGSNILSFANLVNHIEISEAFPLYSKILQVNASYGTQSSSLKMNYSLIPTVDSFPFGIQRNNGWIFLRRALNFEKSKTHSFKVIATNSDHREHQTATASVIVNIIDENDNPPIFDQTTYFFTVDESPVPHGVIGIIKAFDSDSGSNGRLSYFLLSGGNHFLINCNTGEVINTVALDREQKTHHELTVLVADHGSPRRNATTTVFIIVADLNDNKPYFPQFNSGKQIHVKVMEGQTEHMLVVAVYAKDPDAGDNGTVVYFLSSDESFDHFIINSSTGEIWTTQTLSTKLRPQYKLTVIARDQGALPLEEHAVVIVEVVSAFDEISEVNLKNKNIMVPENTEPSQKISSVISHDEALLLNSKGPYRITNKKTNAHFAVDDSTGAVYVSQHLDFEAVSYYGLTVGIQDYNMTSPPNHSVLLSINIEDTNDHSPLFPDQILYLGIWEDIPVGTRVYTFKAMDKDGSFENSKVRYSLNIQDIEENPFFIHEWEGSLSIVSKLDRETVESFVILVTATDHSANVSHRRSNTLVVRVFVQDLNDNIPVFLSSHVASVMENAGIGSFVHQIIAKDPDKGRNGKLEFHISEGNAQKIFMLDEVTGWLTLQSTIDREFQSSFSLTIIASDDGIPSLSATQTLTINLIDVNDEAPVFMEELYEVGIPENQHPGLYVTRVGAKDNDSDSNMDLTYEIVPSMNGTNGYFRINSQNGELFTTTTFDREDKDHFIIKVLVKDSGSPPLSSTAAVLCTILDENDNTPEILSPGMNIQVPENHDLGIIHTVLANDKDAGNNGRLHFHIIGGNTGDYFIINNTSGEVWATRSLDREDVSNFTIIVECYDMGSPQKSAIAKLHITVLDENDNPPTFSKSQYRTSVREDTEVGSVVLKLQATDADEGFNQAVMYSIIDDTQGVFVVNSTSGNIITKRSLDRELKHQYVFRVMATDCSLQGPKSSSVKVLIQIEDVNDNSPVFKENPVHVLISPTILVNRTVATVQAKDMDLGLNGKVVLNLLQPDPFFYITQESGEVKLKNSLPTESYRGTILHVQASDLAEPANTAIGLVIIHIQGLENDISFEHNVYEAIIMENSEAGTTVVTVKTQNHHSNREIIHYNIFSEDKDGTFTINALTGELSVKEPQFLDFEVMNEINLIISAESSKYITYCRVIVFIQDTNDNVPVFDKQQYTSFVLEGQDHNTFVTQVFATDADSGVNAQIDYSIINGNENNVFLLDSRHGILSTNVILDREIKSSYRLIIQAADQGSPKCSSTSVIRVLIVDINDNAPTIPPLNALLIAEDTFPGYSLGRVSANDVDFRPIISYAFTENGNPGFRFAVDKYTGVITLIGSLDYEESSQHCLKIQASDSVYNTVAEVTVIVMDINDNPPFFIQDLYKVTVPELTALNTYIITVSAMDKDSEIYGPITYRILSPLNGFGINISSGAVYTDLPIEYKEYTETQIIVEAERTVTHH